MNPSKKNVPTPYPAKETDSTRPVGVFDSGIGGLSVLRSIRQQLPYESILYLADQGHVPYGPRSLDEVRAFSSTITRFLLEQGAKLVVVACNAASAAALHNLRQEFPAVHFVGMEPAVKPAAETTKTGQVGVLATPATFQGALYASVVERFAHGVVIHQDPCVGLVNQVEKGELDSAETRAILERALQPMLARGIDTVVLGCTHYPFVIPLIQSICGPSVRVIDPAPAVARQTGRLLQASRLNNTGPGQGTVRFFTTGPAGAFADQLQRLLCVEAPIEQLAWGQLNLMPAYLINLDRPGGRPILPPSPEALQKP
ncbi:MAG TPA: glutamate racemase [Anaerolineaceae bacterium]